MLKTTHGITPLRFRVWLIKFCTSIKPGNPTLWQDPSVRSSLNYYILRMPFPHSLKVKRCHQKTLPAALHNPATRFQERHTHRTYTETRRLLWVHSHKRRN